MTKRSPESCQLHGRLCETVPVMQAEIFLFAKSASLPDGSERTSARQRSCRFKDAISTVVGNFALLQQATRNRKAVFRFIVSNSDACFEEGVERAAGASGPLGECLLNSHSRSRGCSTHANIITRVTGVTSRKQRHHQLAAQERLIVTQQDIVVNSFFNTIGRVG